MYYGNGGVGPSLHPRQRHSDNSGPVAHLGAANTNAIRVHTLARSPFGRTRIMVEMEVKPLGVASDGTGTQFTGWASAGTGGIDVGKTVGGLARGKPYHWRVRVRYQRGKTPFAQTSRWLTMPWNGMGETKFRTPPRTITYTYDKLYRLTQASYSSGESFVYAYDAVGNRTSATDATGTHSYLYDQANRLTQADGTVYQWDANGNLLSDGTSTYTYDAANRLGSITTGAATTT